MSNWTHVAGIFRIDDIRMDDTIPDFEKIFGKTILFEDIYDENLYDKETLPMGSEGSLEMSVVINPKKNSIPSYVVSVYGDLRDHDNPQEIIDWFKEKCRVIDETFVGVRNACIVVENEWNGTVNWYYNTDDFYGLEEEVE